MKYEVIHFFVDLLDNNHAYNVGDTFPHKGMEVSEKRIKELSGSNNKQGVPLIKEIKPKKTTTKKRDKNAD